ncbi:MAG: hypothetical protein Q9195_008208 [Heterodermia aff. obscurata]
MAQSELKSSAHALVVGASGVAGWAVVDQILENYPNHGTFSTITALVNRPLALADSGWPELSPSRPQLDLVSGIDLTSGTADEFSAVLKGKVKNVSKEIAYKYDQNPETESEINRGMLERLLVALNNLAPDLAMVVLASGAMSYGIYTSGGVFKAPFKESMVLTGPITKTIFHFALKDTLREQCKDKAWTWCEIRPDAIASRLSIGFVPNGNAFNLTAHWANYLSLYALVEGQGATVPFPGSIAGYHALSNEASADSIAKISIWASLHPEKSANGELFNIADQAQPSNMSQRWPQLAGYFGLKGTGPVDDPNALRPGAYIKKHGDVLQKYGVKNSNVAQGERLDGYGYHYTFDRQLSLDKAREAGFADEIDPVESWYKAFDRFKRFGMIPS